jgi:hypothetical protein
MNVKLHIERLVVEGIEIEPGQRGLLQAAVETELVNLITLGGVAHEIATGGTIPRVAGHSIQLQSEHGPAEVGRNIAGAVYGGIGK